MTQETTAWADIISGIGGWLAAGGLAGATALGLRKKFAKDTTDIVGERIDRSRAERDAQTIDRLTAQLEQAREKGIQRTDDALKIASLESELTILMRDLQRLLKRMPEDVRTQMRQSGALESSFALLADVDQRIEPKA